MASTFCSVATAMTVSIAMAAKRHFSIDDETVGNDELVIAGNRGGACPSDFYRLVHVAEKKQAK